MTRLVGHMTNFVDGSQDRLVSHMTRLVGLGGSHD